MTCFVTTVPSHTTRKSGCSYVILWINLFFFAHPYPAPFLGFAVNAAQRLHLTMNSITLKVVMSRNRFYLVDNVEKCTGLWTFQCGSFHLGSAFPLCELLLVWVKGRPVLATHCATRNCLADPHSSAAALPCIIIDTSERRRSSSRQMARKQ